MKKSIICVAAILAAGAFSCNMAFSCVSGSTAFSPITALAAEAATGNLIVNISGVKTLSGVTITVTGNGNTYTAVTDAKGQAIFSKLPVNDAAGNAITYTIKETIPDGYMAASAMTTTISAGATVIASIPNTEKTYTIAIDCKDYKTDSTTPSGDAVLNGGSYTVYHDDVAYGTYSIGADGKLCEFTLHGKEYEGKWEVQMDTAPVGYYLTGEKQELGYYDGDTWIALNSSFPQYTHATMHLSLIPISGRLAVQANADDQIRIWLKSSGSYEKCKSSERATLTIEESGKAVQTGLLPFGTYVVENLTTGETVTQKITTYGSIVPVEFEHSIAPAITAYKITFATDDGKVPTGGVYNVLDENGNQVYRFSPTNGEAVIPNLERGKKYTVQEIMAPDGYIADKETYTFTVDTQKLVISYHLISVTTTASTTVTNTTTTTTTSDAEKRSITYELYDQTEKTLLSSGDYDTSTRKVELPPDWTPDSRYWLVLEERVVKPDGMISSATKECVILHRDGTWERYQESTSILYGDVNLDGKVDISDAVLLNKAASGMVTLNDQAAKNADCNDNSELGADDAVVLLQFLVHVENTLPVRN
ncbi:SpaA isopeptide-forming pilin-related protein [uncultured Ruminococcus sp.]|uniref:SpaA isopeptide-forming pilin-related protein n=1 Tax=uncultured Ruminococcus sp. TaxID=165186 RepID=UPI0026652550|nr:SpaA isopeptide-forming pilin-related protein [uncultured Ruminococcus sp.]